MLFKDQLKDEPVYYDISKLLKKYWFLKVLICHNKLAGFADCLFCRGNAWLFAGAGRNQASPSANEAFINLWYHLLKKKSKFFFLLALTGLFLPRMACFCLRMPVFACACLFLHQHACFFLGMPVFASHGLFFASAGCTQHAYSCLGKLPVFASASCLFLPRSASASRAP